MRIRIDIDITAAEWTAWLESMVAAPAPTAATMSPTVADDEDDEWGDLLKWPDDINLDFPDPAPAPEDFLEAESNAIAAAIAWAKGRMGGGHA